MAICIDGLRYGDIDREVELLEYLFYLLIMKSLYNFKISTDCSRKIFIL